MPNTLHGRPDTSTGSRVGFNPNLRYPVPKDTLQALTAFIADNRQCRNWGLVFDRYIGYLDDWRLDNKKGDSVKKEHLQLICETSEERELRDSFVARWRAMTRDLGATVFSSAPAWRYVGGLGRKGPLEIGFNLHPLFGFPVIPGSGLKGLALAQARQEYVTRQKVAKTEDTVSGISELETQIAESFGSTEQAGKAIFFDAIPMTPPKLSVDVVNPHYPDYYNGSGQIPANWQSPIPTFFLTLTHESRFLFAVGGKNHAPAVGFLMRALETLGAGAKTSAGYGYWESITQESNS